MRCGRSDMQASTSGREASASNNLNPNCCRAFPGSRVPAKKCPWNYLVVSSHSNRGSTGRCASKVQPIATASTDSHVTFVPAEEGGKIDGPASMSNQQDNHGGQAWLNSSSASQSPGESKLAAAAVDAKLAELRALVEAQNAVIQQQQHMLERLAAVQASAFSVPNASMLGAPVPSNSPPQQQQQRPSPFDAQRVAYGDRRLNGEYDARFHSTSA